MENEMLKPPGLLPMPDDDILHYPGRNCGKMQKQQKHCLKQAKAHLKSAAQYLKLAVGNNRAIDLAALAAQKTVELIDFALKGKSANSPARLALPETLMLKSAEEE